MTIITAVQFCTGLWLLLAAVGLVMMIDAQHRSEPMTPAQERLDEELRKQGR